MSHLNDEQLEELLSGGRTDDAHLRECDQCRRRLAGKRAVRERLRSAFSSVAPSPGLTERIRSLTAEAARPGAPARKAPIYIRLWPALAAAAVVALVAVPLIMFLGRPPAATAATAALVRIHGQNVAGTGGFHRESDPEKLTAYLKSRSGAGPRKPSLCRCTSLTGCSVADFHGRKVATYCMKTPGGDVSIIVVRETPAELGLSSRTSRGKLEVWLGRHDQANVAAARIGDLTYCAIGRCSHEALGDMLTWAIPGRQSEAGQAPAHVCPFCRSDR